MSKRTKIFSTQNYKMIKLLMMHCLIRYSFYSVELTQKYDLHNKAYLC